MIDVINLEKSFGTNKVLNGITVTVEKGDIMVIIGPSGSGKSTFLRCLNCIEDPTGGQIIFKGADIADFKVDINRYRRHMGMVFQHFNLFNNKTVIQNIMLAPVQTQCSELRKTKWTNTIRRITNVVLPEKKRKELLPITTTKAEIMKNAEEHAIALLKRIGLEDKANVYPSTLSGGQKQRVAIAGIIAMRPDYIVLDEPTAMLDPEGRRKVLKTIKSLNKEYGITVILITHYMDEAAQADRIVVMSKGKVVKEGTPKEIFSQVELVKSLSLDVPQTSEIAYELGKLGHKLSTEAISIDECAQQLYDFLKG